MTGGSSIEPGCHAQLEPPPQASLKRRRSFTQHKLDFLHISTSVVLVAFLAHACNYSSPGGMGSVMPLALAHVMAGPWLANTPSQQWLASSLITLPVYMITEWQAIMAKAKLARKAAGMDTEGRLLFFLGIAAAFQACLCMAVIHAMGCLLSCFPAQHFLLQLAGKAVDDRPGLEPQPPQTSCQSVAAVAPGTSSSILTNALMWTVDASKLNSLVHTHFSHAASQLAGTLTAVNPSLSKQLAELLLDDGFRQHVRKVTISAVLAWHCMWAATSLLMGIPLQISALSSLLAVAAAYTYGKGTPSMQVQDKAAELRTAQSRSLANTDQPGPSPAPASDMSLSHQVWQLTEQNSRLLQQLSDSVHETHRLQAEASHAKQAAAAPPVQQTSAADGVQHTSAAPPVQQTSAADGVQHTSAAPPVQQTSAADGMQHTSAAPPVQQTSAADGVQHTSAAPPVQQTSAADGVQLELDAIKARVVKLTEELEGVKAERAELAQRHDQLQEEKQELIHEHMQLAEEYEELEAAFNEINALEQNMCTDSPADVILQMTSQLLQGRTPTRSQILVIRGAVLKGDNIYQPTALGDALHELHMDRDVERSLMQQLGRDIDASDDELPEDGMSKRAPIRRHASILVNFSDLRSALAIIAADAPTDLQHSDVSGESAQPASRKATGNLSCSVESLEAEPHNAPEATMSFNVFMQQKAPVVGSKSFTSGMHPALNPETAATAGAAATGAAAATAGATATGAAAATGGAAATGAAAATAGATATGAAATTAGAAATGAATTTAGAAATGGAAGKRRAAVRKNTSRAYLYLASKEAARKASSSDWQQADDADVFDLYHAPITRQLSDGAALGSARLISRVSVQEEGSAGLGRPHLSAQPPASLTSDRNRISRRSSMLSLAGNDVQQSLIQSADSVRLRQLMSRPSVSKTKSALVQSKSLGQLPSPPPETAQSRPTKSKVLRLPSKKFEDDVCDELISAMAAMCNNPLFSSQVGGDGADEDQMSQPLPLLGKIKTAPHVSHEELVTSTPSTLCPSTPLITHGSHKSHIQPQRVASQITEEGDAETEPVARILGPMLYDEAEICLHHASSDFQFDAFELARVTGGRPLSSLAYFLLQREGLISRFKLNPMKLVRFLQKMEAGYKPNPYHNATHASDMLQTLHVLLHRSGLVPHYADPLTLMSCYLAAVVHDFEHGGLTNDFLIHTSHALAIRYNDRAPMENHHLAAAFTALRTPDFNFCGRLSKSDYEKMRKTIIELVLATDMKQHFSLVSQFQMQRQAQVHREDHAGALPTTDANADSMDSTLGNSNPELLASNAEVEPMQPLQESERMLSIQIAFKCSDLGHIAESRDVHLKWVAALEEEFFRQGDAERAAGLPISPLFDRTKPGVTKSQVGFFEVVVLPLFKSYVKAFRGSIPLLHGAMANFRYWKAQAPPATRTS